MKASLGKVKNIRGRITCYTATIGEMRSTGATPKAAIDNCEREVLSALERLDRGTLVGRWRDHTYIVAPAIDGWGYWIDTFTRGDYRVSGNWTDRESATNNALHHLAQHLWTASADDAAFLADLPASVASELARWIRFQRDYAKLVAEGKTDVEAHRLACSA